MKTARTIVVEALMHQDNAGYANLVLDSALKNAQLSQQDAAFASAVFYGTIERQNTLDYCLGCYLKGGVQKLDSAVRAILRSGLYQMRYMQSVPDSAAVNEAVKLTRAFRKSSAAGLVNAVLRRAGSLNLEKVHFSSQAQRLSVLQSVSMPIAGLLLKHYGKEAEEILAASFAPAETTIRINYLQNSDEQLQAYLQSQNIENTKGLIPGCYHIKYKGNPAQHPGFLQGRFYVQGEPSQIAAYSLGAQPGQKVLDLCAAPGGKSLALAGFMKNQGELYSCDAAPSRVPLIERAMKRCGVSIAKVLCADAYRYDERFAGADRVLCDVPCSGLGIIGKKPDIRYKQLDELESLCALQYKILENASRYLKKNGVLVYSTCTINPGENTDAVAKFLQNHPDFAPAELPVIPAGALQDKVQGITILPNRCGMDGFYVARLQKKPE